MERFSGSLTGDTGEDERDDNDNRGVNLESARSKAPRESPSFSFPLLEVDPVGDSEQEEALG